MPIRPLDVERLAREFRGARPFPHAMIDGFLDEDFADEVAAAYPSFEEAAALGKQFVAVNELRKIQITDSQKFPDPVRRLNEALASREVREQLSAVTGIEELLYDDSLAGGGMHMTAAHGRLDVHVDFNYLESKDMYRRINVLVYLNRAWRPSWGGGVELWDRDVSKRYAVFEPKHNRAVLFETSEISFHGVNACTCPPEVTRNSFAVYYYTKQPPPGYAGVAHSTIFKARPDERLKKYVLMPAEGVMVEGRHKLRRARERALRLLGRD